MSKKKISKNQPDSFEFNSDNLKKANKIISNYPKEKTAKCCNGIAIYCTKTK